MHWNGPCAISTAFAAQAASAALKDQLAAEKGATAKVQKQLSDAESARESAEQKAKDLAAQLSATGAATTPDDHKP